ncbi:MAG TPA: inositol monophosphatase family protein [Hyphomicrobiales bacterium]|nr:inositol monophosphatase family protein [Hyphomicrobiales bacterium]
MARSALINVMVQAARKAGRVLARDFGEVENLQVSLKGPGDFVTAADLRAEKILIEELGRARPGYPILTEEKGAIPGPDQTHRWIVDPLDGTTNFLHGFPLFSISIALEREGQIVAGLIYNPVTDDLFTGERGKGAFLNDRRIRVAARTSFSQALLTLGLPHSGRGNHALALRELQAVMGRVAGLRRTGSAALDLAYVAAGRFDGFWEHALAPWDIAAGILMVREAGGFVTDATGGTAMFETGSIVAGNETIHGELLKLLKSAASTESRPSVTPLP